MQFLKPQSPSIPYTSVNTGMLPLPPSFAARISDPMYVLVFDTTLRDGEQSPGATMTTEENLDITRQLARLGVDIIEAGFPASSEAVKKNSLEVGNDSGSDHVPVICGLERCIKRDIEKSWEAVKYAKKPRIHVFIATSEIHMKDNLTLTPDQVIDKVGSMVAYARTLGCNDVEFSPEDAASFFNNFLYLDL